MKKIKQLFFFFRINDVPTFKAKLQNDIAGLITTTTQLLSVDTQPVTAVNLAFSKPGLDTLGIVDDTGDVLFNVGEEATLSVMGDDSANWVPQFLGQQIHGVFLLASDVESNIDSELASIQSVFGSSISEVYSLAGAARPGNEQGHERESF